MKPMLDNDLDQLFKSSLEDFEVAPTANSWDKITAGLDQKPKTKKYPIFWMAAASVLIVASIGITLFNQDTDVIKLKGDQTKELAAIEKPVKKETLNNYSSQDDVQKSPENAIETVRVAKTTFSVATLEKTEKNLESDATNSTIKNVFNTNEQEEENNLAIVKTTREKTVTEQILETEALNNQIKNKTQENTLIAQNTTDKNLEGNGNQPDRKLKMKSIGDLVNYVVAKVDKREEKIIKVSKTSESDNEITGINLGLIRYSKLEK